MLETIPLKGALDAVRRFTTIKKEMSDIEFQEAILDLRSTLLDAQEDILTLRAENIELKEALKAKADKIEQENDYVIVEGFKYDLIEGKPKGLPYCPRCEVKEDGKLFRLSRQNEEYSLCVNCDVLHNAGRDGLVNRDSPEISQPGRDNRYFP